MCEMSEDDKPRERLLEKGARSLSNAELLGVLLRTGSPGMNAVETGRSLLAAVGNSLESLLSVGIGQMCSIKGVGVGKAVGIIAALELGRRLAVEKSHPAYPVKNSSDACARMKPLFTVDPREECWCMFLKRNRRAISCVRISEGGESLTEMDVKNIIRQALDLKATAVILAHNHPSGDPHPSVADVKATKKLSTALSTFELSLMDHIILGDGRYYSFNDNDVFKQ